MKKLTTIAIVAIFATFTLTSCKKTHTCTCTDSTGFAVTQTWPDISKKDAKTACDNLDAAFAADGNCTLD